jgi:hypothetical protein
MSLTPIDPQIVEHEIKTYDKAKSLWKNLQPINPKKVVSIKGGRKDSSCIVYLSISLDRMGFQPHSGR